jgi:hypothetical protein
MCLALLGTCPRLSYSAPLALCFYFLWKSASDFVNLVTVALWAFISTLRSAKNHQKRARFWNITGGTSTRRSSELCKIDYFLIAHNLKMMLYLQRSQINVPKRPPVGKLFPPSSCSRRFDRKHDMRRFLKELGTASMIKRLRFTTI